MQLCGNGWTGHGGGQGVVALAVLFRRGVHADPLRAENGFDLLLRDGGGHNGGGGDGGDGVRGGGGGPERTRVGVVGVTS